jgi:hypothetical protein
MPKPTQIEKYTYRVIWSEEDHEHAGLVVEFPSLSWLAPTAGEALSGITQLVADVFDDMARAMRYRPSRYRHSLRHCLIDPSGHRGASNASSFSTHRWKRGHSSRRFLVLPQPARDVLAPSAPGSATFTMDRWVDTQSAEVGNEQLVGNDLLGATFDNDVQTNHGRPPRTFRWYSSESVYSSSQAARLTESLGTKRLSPPWFSTTTTSSALNSSSSVGD